MQPILPFISSLIVFAALVYAVISFKVARRFTSARRMTPVAEAGFARFEHHQVTFMPRHEALQLFAWYFPAQSGRAVILVHGKDACRGQEFKASSFLLTAKLIEEGFSVFMIDMRG